MDLPSLQSEFTQYLQSLLVMGYLDRSEFRMVCVASVHASGLPSEYFSLFRDCTDSMLRVMEQALAKPVPDFPVVIEMADHLSSATARIGAGRIRSMAGYISTCATTANKQGCLRYLRMTRLEHDALSYSLSVITELGTSILRLGGEIPLNW
ncbi:hypothetical protein MLD38_026412 [Melastoma candidum]|uniref:Uncharacterized protein n=1 Tax=Melastoma candidum TaxID=119954 RepID=A0ACB9NZI6_9MYRT|nr:hypothetical protein MLD38_026412 [Melastoma candidum]